MRRLLQRHLPGPLLRLARLARSRIDGRGSKYAKRIASETRVYAHCENVHDLPAIFHYWSNRYLRPKCEPFGFSNPDEFFGRYLTSCYEAAGEGPRRFVSIGAGNGDLEIRLAATLVASGRTSFVIECLDLNEEMLARARQGAAVAGVSAQVVTLGGDLNEWRPRGAYDAVIANQSLHHVLRLERLFDAVHKALRPHGRFVVADIIGRNGHLRWPEARRIVDEFWKELPAQQRFNTQLRRQEDDFEDWDCSVEGFEGIRAQDVLPLLVERFGFELFLGFANVIDPFIDRAFGPNFDATLKSDTDFIDRVHLRDEDELVLGRVKPTHMFAVMHTGSNTATRHLPGLSPNESIRWPDHASRLR